MKPTGVLSSVVFLAALAVYPLAAQDAPRNDSKPAQGETKAAPQAHPSEAKPEGHPGEGHESSPAEPPRAGQPQDRAPQEQRQAQDQARHAQQEQQHQQQEQEHQQRAQQKQAEQQRKDQEKSAQQQQKVQQKQAEEQQKQAQRQQDQERRSQNGRRSNEPAPGPRAQNSPPARPTGSQQRRIPDDRFRAHFGREHPFHVSRPVVVEGRPRFQYSGYWFELVDPWPAEWSYDDDCYIDYVDDEYWLFDPVHPGVRIALFVEF